MGHGSWGGRDLHPHVEALNRRRVARVLTFRRTTGSATLIAEPIVLPQLVAIRLAEQRILWTA